MKKTKLTLPALSNFGEKVSYQISSTANCSINGSELSFLKVGACYVRASANGVTDSYKEMKQTLSFKIR